MKTLEYNSTRAWVNTVLNWWPFCLDTDWCGTLLAGAWDKDGIYWPGDKSLFYNGAVMFRIMLPFGLWLHIKPLANLRFQCGIGWKLNGRIALTFRLQSDESAAKGVSGPNYGQAGAWDRGTA